MYSEKFPVNAGFDSSRSQFLAEIGADLSRSQFVAYHEDLVITGISRAHFFAYLQWHGQSLICNVMFKSLLTFCAESWSLTASRTRVVHFPSPRLGLQHGLKRRDLELIEHLQSCGIFCNMRLYHIKAARASSQFMPVPICCRATNRRLWSWQQ